MFLKVNKKVISDLSSLENVRISWVFEDFYVYKILTILSALLLLETKLSIAVEFSYSSFILETMHNYFYNYPFKRPVFGINAPKDYSHGEWKA